MNDFYEISTALQDKYEYLKYRMGLIMFNEKPYEYTPDWSWDTRKKSWMGDGLPNYHQTVHDAEENGKQSDILKGTQSAFDDLVLQTRELGFDYNRKLDFIVFESLFYTLINDAYLYQRYSAESEKLISIESAKECLNDEQFEYISIIYNIIQLKYTWWLFYRDNFDNNESIKNTKAYKAGIFLTRIETHVGNVEYWTEIKKLATTAHDLLPFGELANRIMLISDIQLIYGVGEWKDVYDPANEELVKYLEVRRDTYGNPTFILDCFSDDFEDYCKPLGWLNGLPHIEGRTTHEFISSKCLNEEESKDFCDSYYRSTMMFPASIYLPQMDGQFLTSVAKEIRYSNYLKQTNKELENKNAALDKAQQDKKQIIAEFAHTYGNMQATTLQDIGTELLSVADDLLHEWGRKIMVEYAIKQNLTKEVEMLKLQFEDQSSALIQKLKDSMSSDDKSISDLVSDSLQRCFMALLYGETKNDKSKRSLFFGTDDYSDRRETLQESFEQKVLIGEEKALTWLNVNHVLNISVEVSGMWQALFFDDGGYAALLLTNWITELLTNAIKYADKTKQIALSFSQKDDMLIISIQNIKEPSAIRIHGTQQGISSITASIRRLNQAVDCDENVESKNEDDDAYRLQLFLSSKVISS